MSKGIINSCDFLGDMIINGGSTIQGPLEVQGNLEIQSNLIFTSQTLESTKFWTQSGQDIDGETADDRSGSSVSLSSDGNTVAIGAEKNDGNGNLSGHTRIYDWNSSIWVQRGQDIDGSGPGVNSGYSVSLSSDGNTVAIGANDNLYGYTGGNTRIFDWNSTAWVQRGADINGEGGGDRSGTSVSLSSDGNTVAIGAIRNDGNGSNSGHTRVFDWNGTSWIQRGQDIDGEASSDQSGQSVSLSSNGNTVAIGANLNDGNGADSGHTRVFDWIGTLWVQRGADINGEAAGDQSGYSVSLSSDGDIVAIGSIGNDGNGNGSGHTRVFYWNGTSWIQRGQDIDGEAANDQSGCSVSLSSDGNTVAIGAKGNDANGGNSGHTRVFDWNGGTMMWEQRGSDIDGEAAGDNSGHSVSLSSDGNTVAIGAPFNDANGSNSGHTRIFVSGENGYLKIKVNGTSYYIPLLGSLP
jgi:FG-GAP repeat